MFLEEVKVEAELFFSSRIGWTSNNSREDSDSRERERFVIPPVVVKKQTWGPDKYSDPLLASVKIDTHPASLGFKLCAMRTSFFPRIVGTHSHDPVIFYMLDMVARSEVHTPFLSIFTGRQGRQRREKPRREPSFWFFWKLLTGTTILFLYFILFVTFGNPLHMGHSTFFSSGQSTFKSIYLVATLGVKKWVRYHWQWISIWPRSPSTWHLHTVASPPSSPKFPDNGQYRVSQASQMTSLGVKLGSSQRGCQTKASIGKIVSTSLPWLLWSRILFMDLVWLMNGIILT